MTWAEFKRKWSRYKGKESSAYQEHFNDLCRLLEQPTPNEADPSGSDFFCFQKRVVKDLELMVLKEDGSEYGDKGDTGFADVWKKDCFAWEYKGKKKNLDAAFAQLLRYTDSLANPPLLIVCDFENYIVYTRFNGFVQEKHPFTNADIDNPRNLRILKAAFSNPDFLKPQRTTAQVTEDLAKKIAEVARSLQSRESVELADARARKEVKVAEKQNLRIARFLNRIIFCFFAEDVGLLPPNIFTEVAQAGLEDPSYFAERLGELFRVMAKGGSFGAKKIRHFNGHLFDEATVFELTLEEIRLLAEASEADWQFIEPSIMGTLFERALDDNQRAKLGAHYTSETDIKTLVEPVLMQPLRREWTEIKRELMPLLYKIGSIGVSACASEDNKKAQARRPMLPNQASARIRLEKFHRKISTLAVLDPACGSGNFLYVSLQLLLGLEKELLAFATTLGFGDLRQNSQNLQNSKRKKNNLVNSVNSVQKLFRQSVGVHQLHAIEINPYAFELAQVSVQIGYLQWMRDNGFPLDRSPVLQVLDGFQNEDALLVPHYRSKAKTLKQARAKEHEQENALKFYTEREWPQCDVIVSNPPFLGDKLMRAELGDDYVEELRRIFTNRIPGGSDLCCYWFEKARELIKEKKCSRSGLLATQGIRGGANREVLNLIKQSGDIFFAFSDRDWILNGASVHVSMVGFDDGREKTRTLDGKSVSVINSNLSSAANIASSVALIQNADLGFIGTCKGGSFDIAEAEALKLLSAIGNPHGRPNSDVLKPILNAQEFTKRSQSRWLIDFEDMPMEEAAKYETPFKLVSERVKPSRDKNRDTWLRTNWWKLQRIRPEMRRKIQTLSRFVSTPRHSKYRVFLYHVWPVISDDATVVFASATDSFFGVLHSRVHEVWSRAQGTQVRERESGLRYTPTTCFETFPFPNVEGHAPSWQSSPTGASRATDATERVPPAAAAIAAAAKELNDLRERWLNPPEWTRQTFLEFAGSTNGPWARYISKSPNPNGGTGVPPVNKNKKNTGETPVPPSVSPSEIGKVRYPRLEPKDADCAKKLKERTLTKLYNERPAWLDLAHKKLDAAVAAAYGFPTNLTDEQILERLLKLNQECAAEELKSGKTKPSRVSREKNAEEML